MLLAALCSAPCSAALLIGVKKLRARYNLEPIPDARGAARHSRELTLLYPSSSSGRPLDT